MKNLAVVLFFTSLFTNLQAQKIVGGEWSVGPRFGGSSGISLKKHSASNKSAFELVAANAFDKKIEGFSLTALYQKLAPLNENGQLSAFYGGGINLNFKDQTKFGVSGIIGFDWRLKKAPLTLQLDWLPSWYFINESYFSGINGAFTIRYVVNRKKFERK